MEKQRKILYKGKMVAVIDITPTWESLLPVMFSVLEGDNYEAKKGIKSEITRMAKALDRYNAENKKKQNESGKTKTGKL